MTFRNVVTSMSLSGLLVVSCTAALADGPTAATGQDPRQSPGKVITEVKIRDLNKSPDKFTGSDVTVTGKVTKIEGPGAFIVEGSGLLNNKILVVVQKPKSDASSQQPGTIAPVIKEKQNVELTGKVDEIGVTKIERDYTPLKTEIKAEFEGNMPVLVVPPNGIKDLG